MVNDNDNWKIKENNIIRALGYLFVIVTSIIHVITKSEDISSIEIASILGLAFYFVFTCSAFSMTSMRHLKAVSVIMLFVDSLIYGAFIAYMKSSPLICFMLLIMQSFVFVGLGGIYYWVNYMFLMLLTALCLSAFFQHAPVISIYTEGVGGIYTMIFTFLVAMQRKDRTDSLMRSRQEQLASIKKLKTKSEILSNYLAPQIVEMHEKSGKISSNLQRKKLTVCFIDIVGFSTLTERTEPEIIASFLKDFFSEMTKVALEHGGTIDKFIGDGIMVFFGDPSSNGFAKDALNAVNMSRNMHLRMRVLNDRWSSILHADVFIRVGINTGLCNVGNIGSDSRLAYTAIGKTVNIASRIEGMAEPNGICVGYETYAYTKDKFKYESIGKHFLKGMSLQAELYKVVGIEDKLFIDKIIKNGVSIEIKSHSREEFIKLREVINGYEKQ